MKGIMTASDCHQSNYNIDEDNNSSATKSTGKKNKMKLKNSSNIINSGKQSRNDQANANLLSRIDEENVVNAAMLRMADLRGQGGEDGVLATALNMHFASDVPAG